MADRTTNMAPTESVPRVLTSSGIADLLASYGVTPPPSFSRTETAVSALPTVAVTLASILSKNSAGYTACAAALATGQTLLIMGTVDSVRWHSDEPYRATLKKWAKSAMATGAFAVLPKVVLSVAGSANASASLLTTIPTDFFAQGLLLGLLVKDQSQEVTFVDLELGGHED